MSDKFEDFKKDMPEWVKTEADFELYKIRHTTEHIFNQAVEELFPNQIVRAMGPAIADGWYNDSRWEVKPSEEDFEKIEKRMLEIIKDNLPLIRKNINEKEAREMFKDNPFKQEFIDEFIKNGSELTVYYTGDPDSKEGFKFVDLCRGPHIDSTGKVKAFKLLSVAGAYWRGDEKNEMLTRIYGTAFESNDDLKKYLTMVEETKKRDHRILGKNLDLFMFSDLVGGGLPLWTPRGTLIRNELDKLVWELREAKGYEKVTIPHITKRDLYETSGHWEKFADELFHIDTREGHEFAMKPMNCPHHTQIYAHLQRSYKDLPQRYAETTMVYRDEQSGELSGLSRVRCITQDDAHVFCRHVQIRDEFFKIWDIVDKFYTTFGFELKVRLSFHDPENFKAYLGTPEIWAKAENALEGIAKERGVNFFIAKGEAAMYGPKIDFMTHDSIGRQWQVATIQLDMNMPERFDLYCINEKGERERIVMLHAAIMGSIERFSSVLIEHLAGAFPAWLSPEQVRIIPISEDNLEYAENIQSLLKEKNIRVKIDGEAERMQNKIREAQEMKVPYMVVIGKREAEEGTISLRYRNKKENVTFKLEEFVEKLVENIKARKLEIDL